MYKIFLIENGDGLIPHLFGFDGHVHLPLTNKSRRSVRYCKECLNGECDRITDCVRAQWSW